MPAARKKAAKKAEAKQSTEGKTTQQEESGEQSEEQSEGLSPYQPRHLELENAGMDQNAAEEARQAELQAERDEHNRRTGDVSR